MAEEAVLVGLAAILVLGVGAQWLAWRLKIPSILLLLIVGFVAGGMTGFLDPDALLGDLLLPVVAISVGIILFEGGLDLAFKEIRGHGPVVTRLVTMGALITWLASAGAAHHLVGLPWDVAFLVGAILVVTGPTVVGPLLRHVRPRGSAGSVIKWEGILIDPIGAVLAVLVFEAVNAGSIESATSAVALGVVKTAVAGLAAGLAGAGLLWFVLWRKWVPDFLESPVTLGVVITAFVAADTVQSESGLLATTVMGIALANQTRVPVHRIVEFKENLRVLLIAGLFVLLAARLRIADLSELGWGSAAFIAALILVVRPLAALASTLRSKLSWRERAFVAAMAPRGIVAAAVASVFALRLDEAGNAAAATIVPIVFLVIVSTVAVYGLGATPLARALGIGGYTPQGVIVVGAHPFGRALVRALRAEDVKVLLTDTNRRNVDRARDEGLPARLVNVLDREFRESVDFEGFGRLVALTSNDEVNTVAALTYADVFGREEAYQVAAEGAPPKPGEDPAAARIRGRILFGNGWTCDELDARVRAGDEVHIVDLPMGQFDPAYHAGASKEPALPLFVVSASGRIHFATADTPLTLRPNVRLAYLGGERTDEDTTASAPAA